MQQDKSFLINIIKNIDVLFWISLLFLIMIGLVGIYSASMDNINPIKYVTTQSVALVIGIVVSIFLVGFNYQYYKHFKWPLYVFACLLLISVLFLGSTIKGTKGWFNFGLFSFQPVEITKIIFILVLSGYLDAHWKEVERLSNFCKCLLIMLGHVFLIMLQPDFSSTLCYFPITLVLLYVAGAKIIHLASIILYGSLALGIPLLATFLRLDSQLVESSPILMFLLNATQSLKTALLILLAIILIIIAVKWFLNKLKIPIGWTYPVIFLLIIIAGSFSSVIVDKSLKEYQRKRLIVFLKPTIDSRGSGYNIIQSKISIGSGGISGKGFFKGTQTHLGFLPEQRTDFIFSVVGEEGGYLFAQLTILFYFLFIWRALVIARTSRDRYGSFVATGIAAMFAFYSIINIGMVMGCMPITGLPLPLLSYGGSSMLSSIIAIGILLSIHIRSYSHY